MAPFPDEFDRDEGPKIRALHVHRFTTGDDQQMRKQCNLIIVSIGVRAFPRRTPAFQGDG
jgi:hypothetical protein